MRIRISGTWTLSNEHAASSYGQAVLVNLNGNAYGPGDVVQLFPSYGWLLARDAVARLTGSRHFEPEADKLIAAFCRNAD